MAHCDDLAERFVAVWNETDDLVRRQLLESIWAGDGSELTPAKQTVGHDALEIRITASHRRNVTDGGCRFESMMDAQDNHGVVRFGWRMVRLHDGCTVATGSYVLVTQTSGKVAAAYFFTHA